MRPIYLWERANRLSFLAAFLFLGNFTLIPYLLFSDSVWIFENAVILTFVLVTVAFIVADLVIHLIQEKKIVTAIRVANKFLLYGNLFGWCVLALRHPCRKIQEFWSENLAPLFSLVWQRFNSEFEDEYDTQ